MHDHGYALLLALVATVLFEILVPQGSNVLLITAHGRTTMTRGIDVTTIFFMEDVVSPPQPFRTPRKSGELPSCFTLSTSILLIITIIEPLADKFMWDNQAISSINQRTGGLKRG